MKVLLSVMLVLVLASSAMAQAPEDLKPLAAKSFTRSFNEHNVSLEYTLRAGPLMEPGKRRFIELDIDTLMRDDAASSGEFGVPLNGFIAIALPPGIEPDGELRMKFYNGATGRYDFMYSAGYPEAMMDGQFAQFAADAGSRDARQILAGLKGISTSLDGSISFQGPQDPRLTGGDSAYAVTGTSWLIPCNSLFNELVSPFSPEESLDYNPRLKATLPVRIAETVSNPQIILYAGSLSTAVRGTTVMSDAIPADVMLLEQPPAMEQDTTEAAEEAQENDNEAEPAEEVPAPVALRALQFSFGWAEWESAIDLSAVIIQSALDPDYSPQAPVLAEQPVNLDPPSGPVSISAADRSERLLDEAVPAEVEATAEAEDSPAEDAPQPEMQDEDVDDAEEAAEPPATEETTEEAVGQTEGTMTEDAEAATGDEAAEAGSGEDEEAVPGSLAELKEAVEDRRERETGNSVNIELPPTARETTEESVEEVAQKVNEIQDEQLQQAAAQSGEVVEENDAPAERDDIPAFAFPEELEAAEADAAQASGEDVDSGAESTASEQSADGGPLSDGAEVREVEPGTLPGEEDMHSVPLKQITGRDGRQPPGQGSSAPDYTQLYIGGGPSSGAAGSTTPGDLGEMVFVPGGNFMMGTDEKASAGDEDERPLHEVFVDDFYIDKYPVTNRQFYQFVLSDGYKPQGNWQKYFEPGTADMPVRGVTWEDANAYCSWAGKRLPTEAEWEKAARGDDGRLYPWGNDWSSEILPRGSLNYRLVLNQKAASPYGALAMVGVLWQWTASSWAPYPFDPEADNDVKVLRGGAFSNGRNIIRCANRYPEDASVGFNTFTFRCARDAN